MNSPINCGTCGKVCAAGQTCAASACACLPGLKACGNACVDTNTDGANCGGCGIACTGGNRCINGSCSATQCFQLTPQEFNCNGGCVTQAYLQTSPLHCGNCFTACAGDQVCVPVTGGVQTATCRNYFTSASCTTSPCPACGTGSISCTLPGTTEIVCVTGNTCPL